MGTVTGEFKGELTLVPWLLVEGGKYKEAQCTLRPSNQTKINSSDLYELACYIEENFQFIKFFDTTAYDKASGFVWIGASQVYQLLDCGLSFIKTTGLLLLFALLF